MQRNHRVITTYVLTPPFGLLLNLAFLLFNLVMIPWVMLIVGALDHAPGLLAHVPQAELAQLRSVSPGIVFLTLFVGNGLLMVLGMILPGTKVVTDKDAPKQGFGN